MEFIAKQNLKLSVMEENRWKSGKGLLVLLCEMLPESNTNCFSEIFTVQTEYV